jgi:2'-5' RNA ligase
MVDSRGQPYYVRGVEEVCVSETTRIRSFVAVDLEAPVCAALQALQEELTRTGADVRWVRAGGLHVTLKFLGSVDAARLEQVHAALITAVAGATALRVRAHGIGAFPSLRRPRVLWAGVDGPDLGEVAARVEDGLFPLGFEQEKRGFTPHVTLGRVNSLRGWPRLEAAFKAHLDDEFGTSLVDTVAIYRSTLRPDGAVYTALWTIPLSRYKPAWKRG